MVLENVYIMNKDTWDRMRNDLLETASKQQNPLHFIGKISEIDVRVDNTLPDDVVEVMDKFTYEALQIYKKKPDEGSKNWSDE